MIEVRHDTAACQFIADVEGRRAVLDYTICGDVMTITHTGVPAAIGGRGIAGELVRARLERRARCRMEDRSRVLLRGRLHGQAFEGRRQTASRGLVGRGA